MWLKRVKKICTSLSTFCDNINCTFKNIDEFNVSPEDEIIVALCETNKSHADTVLKQHICRQRSNGAKINVEKRQQVTLIVGIPSRDLTSSGKHRSPENIYIVGDNPPTSGHIQVTGRVVLNEAQKPVLLVNSWKTVAELRPPVSVIGFDVFKNNPIGDIVKDIQRQIRITGDKKWGDVFMDLVFLSSPLRLRFNGNLIRGTLDTAECGDSGQAKSLRKKRLNDLIGRPIVVVNCSTASTTGIVYAIDTHKRGRYIRLGAVPLNNGGYVLLDEGQMLIEDDIRKLRSIRSEGELRVDRILNGEFPCVLRLAMICNSRYPQIRGRLPISRAYVERTFFATGHSPV